MTPGPQHPYTIKLISCVYQWQCCASPLQDLILVQVCVKTSPTLSTFATDNLSSILTHLV